MNFDMTTSSKVKQLVRYVLDSASYASTNYVCHVAFKNSIGFDSECIKIRSIAPRSQEGLALIVSLLLKWTSDHRRLDASLPS